jgi:ATP-dependent helicase YprA (DUF1998 family)
VEGALFGGTLMGVAATNALELGIDVGSLDITLHLGFPGAPPPLPPRQTTHRSHAALRVAWCAAAALTR